MKTTIFLEHPVLEEKDKGRVLHVLHHGLRPEVDLAARFGVGQHQAQHDLITPELVHDP